MAKKTRILIAECMQEISSFNPLPSGYANFHIERGSEMLAQASLNTAIAGACSVFKQRSNLDLCWAIAARAGSGGLLSAKGWATLSEEIIASIRAAAKSGVDAVYFSMHGAMAADGELDPEGWLLTETRRIVGPDVPIVISLDLHGILTGRMIRQIDGMAIYRTYPHVDFFDTGERAAKFLLRILDDGLKPAIIRVVIPALVRGDELITKYGCYGDLLRECQRLEADGAVLAAGIMIGNPFTDVPELCSQVLIAAGNDTKRGAKEALRLAGEFWPQRFRMQGKLIAVERAVAQAKQMPGPVIFTDAADATSSGATGDSNVLIDALRADGYSGSVLAQIVDPAAAAACHKAGVGAEVTVKLGGCHDKARFKPSAWQGQVKLLSDGRSKLETMRIALNAGPAAVLQSGNFTVVILSKTLSLFDRAMYYSNGLDPVDFDLIVVKSPHTEYHMYDQWARKNFNVDAPGSTSANLPYLGHTICARPMYPMELETSFKPKPVVYQRRRG